VLLSENADPDFRQDDAFVRACPEFNSGMTATISVPIQPPGLNSFKSSLEGVWKVYFLALNYQEHNPYVKLNL